MSLKYNVAWLSRYPTDFGSAGNIKTAPSSGLVTTYSSSSDEEDGDSIPSQASNINSEKSELPHGEP